MCLGTNSRALSYCQRGFTGFTFSGAAFATANALQGERARGCRNEQVLVPASLIPPPGAHPSAPHARLREPNPVPPPASLPPASLPPALQPLCAFLPNPPIPTALLGPGYHQLHTLGSLHLRACGRDPFAATGMKTLVILK